MRQLMTGDSAEWLESLIVTLGSINPTRVPIRKAYPSLQGSLAAAAASAQHQDDPERLRRTTQLLSQIAAYSRDAAGRPEKRDRAVRSLQAMVSSGIALDPTTFERLDDYLALASKSSTTSDMDGWLSGGMSIGSSLLGISSLHPGYAAALAVGSVIVEPSLQYLKSPENVFTGYLMPKARGIDLQIVHDMALRASFEMAAKNETTDVLLDFDELRRATGISIKAPVSQIRRALPPVAKQLTSNVPDEVDPRAPVQTDDTITQATVALMQAQMKGLSASIAEVDKLLKEEADARRLAEKSKREQERLERKRTEVLSGVQLGANILTLLGHSSPVTAAAVSAAQTAIQLSRLTEQFQAGAIGPLALANGYASAAMVLAQLFSASKSTDALILEGIADIRRDLQTLRTEMHYRFDVLERGQIEIVKRLDELLNEVRAGNNRVVDLLYEVRSDTGRVIEGAKEAEREKALTSLAGAINGVRALLNGPRNNASVALYTLTLEQEIGTAATRTSTTSPFVGSRDDATDTQRLAEALQARRRVDLVAVALPAVAERFGGAKLPGAGVLNPMLWCLASEAYLQGCLAGGLNQSSESIATATAMWRLGLGAQELFRGVGSKQVLEGAARAFAVSTGISQDAPGDAPNLVGRVGELLDRFQATKLNRWQLPASSAVRTDGVTNPGRFYTIPVADADVHFIHTQGTTVKLDEKRDPFILARDYGLIKLKQQPTPALPIRPIDKLSVFSIEPREDLSEDLKSILSQGQVIKTVLDRPDTEVWSSYAVQVLPINRPAQLYGDPLAMRRILLGCYRAVREYVDYPRLVRDLPAWLDREVRGDDVMKALLADVSVERLAVAVTCARRIESFDPSIALSFDNAPSMFDSREELLASVRGRLSAPAGERMEWMENGWKPAVLEAIRTSATDNAAQIARLIATYDVVPSERSIFMLDEQMKRIGAYITGAGHQVPLPAKKP